MQNHRFFKIVFTASGVLTLLLLIGFSVSAQWAPPTVAPPGGNVPAPLNVGGSSQSKGGNLALNLDGLLANGLFVPFGNVGFGMTPAADKRLDVSGKANATELCIAGDCKTSWSAAAGSGGWTDDGTVVRLTTITDNVGIGTTNPSRTGGSYRLDVAGANAKADADGDRVVTFMGSNDASFPFGLVMGFRSNPISTSRYFFLQPTDPGIGYRNLVLNQYGGNVGIGTVSPGRKLELSGTPTIGIKITDTAAAGNAFVELSTVDGGLSYFQNTGGRTRIYVGGDERMTFLNTGNVGIGTTSPGYKLDVAGTAGLGQTYLKNSDVYFTDTAHSHTGIGNTAGFAAIENASNYNTLMILGRSGGIAGVRSVSIWDRLDVNGSLLVNGQNVCQQNGTNCPPSGGDNLGNHIATTNLNMSGFNISGVNKLTASVIDPVYEIGGKKYATYVADFAGGLKTEVTGTAVLENGIKIIDFDTQQAGSDLWLFWQTSNKNVGDITALLTPGFEGGVWYEKIPSENKIIIKSNQNGEVSFRLTAPRKDAAQWPNEIKE